MRVSCVILSFCMFLIFISFFLSFLDPDHPLSPILSMVFNFLDLMGDIYVPILMIQKDFNNGNMLYASLSKIDSKNMDLH
jgi:hypothetical protein